MITDRTSQDVARWKELHDKGWFGMTAEEQAEWNGTMKGRYNETDLNRVETAVKELSERCVEMGYLDTPLTTNTSWTAAGVPTKSQMTRYLGNIATLRSLVTVYPTTPLAPTLEQPFTYETANDIEKILVDIDNILTQIPQGLFYAGDVYSGEV